MYYKGTECYGENCVTFRHHLLSHMSQELISFDKEHTYVNRTAIEIY